MRNTVKQNKPRLWTKAPPGFKRFTTYLDEKLLEALKEHAKANHKSLLAVVNAAVKAAVKK